MLTVLITGSDGQLGNEFRKASVSYPHYHFIFTDVAELDITDAEQIEHFFSHYDIDVVINCAAYTAVDRAEEEPEKAMLINRDAVAVMVQACKKHDAYLVHISTDYVFDGNNQSPYTEIDLTNPTSSYGRSKLAGENTMLECLQKGMIIRTSWLYSSFGSNFVKTILTKGAELGKLKVVSDQFGCPTYAYDLALAILEIVPMAISSNRVEIYHYSNEGTCSWYEFAKAALEMANVSCLVSPIISDEYPQRAPRPHYSVMDKSKIKKHFGIAIPEWKKSLAECVERLKIEG